MRWRSWTIKARVSKHRLPVRNDKRLSRNHFKTGHVVSPYKTAIHKSFTFVLAPTFILHLSKFKNSLTNTSRLFHPSFELGETPSNAWCWMPHRNEYFQFSTKIDGDARSWLTDKVFTRQVASRPQTRQQLLSPVGAGARGCQPSIEKRRRKCDSFARFGEWKNCGALSRVWTRAAVTCSGWSRWSKRAELQLRRRLQGNRKPSRCSIQVQRYSGTD